jgi:hypothetical protein
VEERILTDHVQYRGGYSGMSFRVARGLYMRTGGSRGNRVITQSLDHVDNGSLYITTQRLVFNGHQSAQELKRAKIAGMDRYSDGVVIKRISGKSLFYGSPDAARLSAHLDRFIAGTLDKEYGGVSFPEPTHSEPINVDVKITMSGQHDAIVSSGSNIVQSFAKEVEVRRARHNTIVNIQERASVAANATTVQSYAHAMLAYIADTAKMVTDLTQIEPSDSNEEYIRKLVLRYAVALEALLDAQEKLRKSDHPEGFDGTQHSVAKFLNDAYEGFATWPKQLADALSAFSDGTQFEAHLRSTIDGNGCVKAIASEGAAWLHSQMGV